MKIQPTIKIWFFSCLIIAYSSVNATAYLEDNNLSLGVDYKISYNKGQDYWNRLLPTSKMYQYVSLFTGKQFNRYLAGEIGYTHSFNISKHSDISGTNMWGTIAPAESKQSIKLSHKTWNLDLNLLCPNDRGGTLLAIMGVGVTKPKISAVNLGNQANDTRLYFDNKHSFLLRAGIGIRFVTGAVGIQAKLLWERFSKVSLKNSEIVNTYPNITYLPFHNNCAWTIGVFYRF